MNKEYKEARDAVFSELFDIASEDRDVVLFTADTGAFCFKEFKAKLPAQFFNVGVAEQNAISVAAGLALVGKKVFVFGISNFVALRCFEQIKVDVCCMNLPVTIIGMGTGYVYPKDGPTHHMVEILSVLRTLPGMTLWSPSDYSMIAGVTRLAYRSGGPNFIYMDKGPFADIYKGGNHDFTSGMQVLREGSDLVIFATGIMVPQAIELIDALEAAGVSAKLVDLYRIKPADPARIAEIIGGCRRVLTLEENTIIGGLGGLVAEAVAESGLGATVKRFGIPDVYHCEIGGREELRALDGFDVKTVTAAVESWLNV